MAIKPVNFSRKGIEDYLDSSLYFDSTITFEFIWFLDQFPRLRA